MRVFGANARHSRPELGYRAFCADARHPACTRITRNLTECTHYRVALGMRACGLYARCVLMLGLREFFRNAGKTGSCGDAGARCARARPDLVCGPDVEHHRPRRPGQHCRTAESPPAPAGDHRYYSLTALVFTGFFRKKTTGDCALFQKDICRTWVIVPHARHSPVLG